MDAKKRSSSNGPRTGRRATRRRTKAKGSRTRRMATTIWPKDLRSTSRVGMRNGSKVRETGTTAKKKKGTKKKKKGNLQTNRDVNKNKKPWALLIILKLDLT